MVFRTEKNSKNKQSRDQPVICHKCKQEGHNARSFAYCGTSSGNYVDASHAIGQAWEDVTNKANVTIDLFAVNPFSAFCIKLVNQYTINFMLDTGAAVSLISSKLWHSLKENVTV